MYLQPITYRGHTVAAAGRGRYFLCDELEQRPAQDPELVFVTALCHYAGLIATGMLPGPYTDDDARTWACAALIPPDLLERDPTPAHTAANWLGIPLSEVRIAPANERPTAALRQFLDRRASRTRRRASRCPYA